MEYLIGIVLSFALTTSATALGFDRERVFYCAVMITVALYYVLFAAMSASVPVVIVESIAAGAFLVLAVVGFKTGLWVVVVALAGHGLFDYFHPLLVDNSGVPRWWPGFCMAFDVVAAGYLAVLLTKRPGLTRPGLMPNPASLVSEFEKAG